MSTRKPKRKERRYDQSRFFVLNDPCAPRVCPDLAVELEKLKAGGLNASLIFLQIEFWMATEGVYHNGKWWINRSVRDIQAFFKFMSVGCVHDKIKSLKNANLLFAVDLQNDGGQWLSINLEEARKLRSLMVRQYAAPEPEAEPEPEEEGDEAGCSFSEHQSSSENEHNPRSKFEQDRSEFEHQCSESEQQRSESEHPPIRTCARDKSIESNKSNKECVHTHAHEAASFDSNSSTETTPETVERDNQKAREKRLMDAIIEGFGKTIQYKMGRTSDNFNRAALKAAQILADESEAYDTPQIAEFFLKFPQWMSQRTGKPVDSVTQPTYGQVTDNFAEVLAFEPNAKKEAPREQRNTTPDRHERNRDRLGAQLSVAAALRNRVRDLGNAAQDERALPQPGQ